MPDRTIITSTDPDGGSWAVAPNLWDNDYAIGRAVAEHNGTFIAVGVPFSGSTGLIQRSVNGTAWIALSSPFDGTGASPWNVAYGGGVWVAVSASSPAGQPLIVRSTDDGLTWTSALTATASAEVVNGVCWTGDRFVAVGSSTPSTEKAAWWTSADGAAWVQHLDPLGANAHANVLFSVASDGAGNVGAYGVVFTSGGVGFSTIGSGDDGASWVGSPLAIGGGGIALSNPIVYGTGDALWFEGAFNSNGQVVVETASLGSSGTVDTVTPWSTFNSDIYGIANPSSGLVVVCGAAADGKALARRIAGVWTEVATPLDGPAILAGLSPLNGVAWSPTLGVWVAVGIGTVAAAAGGWVVGGELPLPTPPLQGGWFSGLRP